MKRLRLIIITLVVVTIGSLVFYLITLGPSYKGRSLAHWLNKYRDARFNPKPELYDYEGGERARLAVKAIGTNAIPTLLNWLGTRDSPTKIKLNKLLDKQKFIRFRFKRAQYYYGQAALGFQLLGIDAKPAVPHLLTLLKSRDPDTRSLALQSLCDVCDEKNTMLPIILQFRHDSDQNLRIDAEMYLWRLYPEEVKSAGLYPPSFKPELSELVQTFEQEADTNFLIPPVVLEDITNRQFRAAVILRDFFPEEAEKEAVYKKFPQLKPVPTNSAATNGSASN